MAATRGGGGCEPLSTPIGISSNPQKCHLPYSGAMAPPPLLGPGFVPPEGLSLGPLGLKSRYLIVFWTFSKLLDNNERKFSPKKEYYVL